jgi:hypothetical protein
MNQSIRKLTGHPVCENLFQMLVIRAAQMRVFEQSVQDQFKQRLKQHLAQFLPARGVALEEAGLREQVERGVAECVRLGFERECDIARCLEIICGSAGGFTDGPLPREALKILYAYRVDPSLKLDRLQAWAEGNGAHKQ